MPYLMKEADFGPLPPLLTLQQAAELLHVTVRSVQRYIQQGRLKVVRTHHGSRGRPLVPRGALADFLCPAEPLHSGKPKIAMAVDFCKPLTSQRPKPVPSGNGPTQKVENDENTSL